MKKIIKLTLSLAVMALSQNAFSWWSCYSTPDTDECLDATFSWQSPSVWDYQEDSLTWNGTNSSTSYSPSVTITGVTQESAGTIRELDTGDGEYVEQYSTYGVGVINSYDGVKEVTDWVGSANGQDDTWYVDNINWTDALLLDFGSTCIALDQITTTQADTLDGDWAVFAYQGNSFATDLIGLTYDSLTANNWSEVYVHNDTTPGNASTSESISFSNTTTYSTYWLVAALNADTPVDGWKLKGFSGTIDCDGCNTNETPVPSPLMLLPIGYMLFRKKIHS